MCTLEKRIRDLINFYVKENYKNYLQVNNITIIQEKDSLSKKIPKTQVKSQIRTYLPLKQEKSGLEKLTMILNHRDGIQEKNLTLFRQ